MTSLVFIDNKPTEHIRAGETAGERSGTEADPAARGCPAPLGSTVCAEVLLRHLQAPLSSGDQGRGWRAPRTTPPVPGTEDASPLATGLRSQLPWALWPHPHAWAQRLMS